MVSAINDHIVPWESAYKTVGLVSGPVRFVLGSGGHIAGIVNPPGPEGLVHGRRRPSDALPPDRRRLARACAERRSGSWWEDWAQLVGRAAPARCRSRRGWAARKHPVLGDGPGRTSGLTP